MLDLFRDIGGVTGLGAALKWGWSQWHQYRFRRALRELADQGDELVEVFEDAERRLDAAKEALLAKTSRPAP